MASLIGDQIDDEQTGAGGESLGGRRLPGIEGLAIAVDYLPGRSEFRDGAIDVFESREMLVQPTGSAAVATGLPAVPGHQHGQERRERKKKRQNFKHGCQLDAPGAGRVSEINGCLHTSVLCFFKNREAA